MSDLKGCICGTTDVQEKFDVKTRMSFVKCMECGIQTGTHWKMSDAREDWNHGDQTPLVQRLRFMAKFMEGCQDGMPNFSWPDACSSAADLLEQRSAVEKHLYALLWHIDKMGYSDVDKSGWLDQQSRGLQSWWDQAKTMKVHPSLFAGLPESSKGGGA